MAEYVSYLNKPELKKINNEKTVNPSDNAPSLFEDWE